MAEEPADVPVPQEEEGGEEQTQAPEPTLDLEAIEEFYKESLGTSQAVDFIASKLEFTEYTTNVKESIEAETYEQMLSYSKNCGLSVEQTSGFIGLFTRVVKALKEGKSKEETEKLSKEALTGMCETIPNFNANIVKFMLDFLAQTVFQHYNLYSYVYQLPQREQDLVNVTLEVETARVPPLSHGELEVEEEEPEKATEDPLKEGAEEGEEGEPVEGDEEQPEDQEEPPVNVIIESEIARRVELLKEKMQAEYAEREQKLLQKLEEIQSN
ncbi:hypothetical protein HOP50_09g56270 [Chloropicon primus]|uniref:Uncharacterized protein n=1 Tax=Chloropicon primus TaxID=1764295 RepID=A0A5B8MS33_9CHLO|nr:hypothetical protein A3770_09p56050 [Chloropicon primus]UPR02301.1 hypothetical protein HOP50_09g56270 [Chloropicon primus]|eukprot:QDZ23087.1 hypothetical protein A3770_09p56050 [Chloropicon primus]